MTSFPRSHVLDLILEHEKTLTSSDNISENIANQDLKFRNEVHHDLGSMCSQFHLLSLCRKKVIMTIP